jgi:hypothetical protein
MQVVMESSRVHIPPSNDAHVQQQDPGFQKRQASRPSRAFLINSLLPRAPKRGSRLLSILHRTDGSCALLPRLHASSTHMASNVFV